MRWIGKFLDRAEQVLDQLDRLPRIFHRVERLAISLLIALIVLVSTVAAAAALWKVKFAEPERQHPACSPQAGPTADRKSAR